MESDTLSGGSSAHIYVYNTAPLSGPVLFRSPCLGAGNPVYKDGAVSPGLLQVIDYSVEGHAPLTAVTFASAAVAARSAVSQTFTVEGVEYGW
ncbi:hypothetical protein [Paenibacillus oceani]|uniref:Uncharacterized protein n=1 Tax=Paenibacillus oceani TaxID=2772510 RepID=A0A927CBX9_9BACL|nr:hypothetical protein [Paenibacillus oceani]MBD2863843.1 hypothetical protein [Paenibacillus oceani]